LLENSPKPLKKPPRKLPTNLLKNQSKLLELLELEKSLKLEELEDIKDSQKESAKREF